MANISFSQNILIADNRGSLSHTPISNPDVIFNIRRWNTGASGTEGNFPGTLGYMVEIEGVSVVNGSQNVIFLSNNKRIRASGLIDETNSISLIPGYPTNCGIFSEGCNNPARFYLAFDMTNSLGPGKQATYVRNWSIQISCLIELPNVFGCTDPNAINYDPSADTDDGSCIYSTPTTSITVNPSSIIRGQSATLSWSVNNGISASISGIGSVSVTGGSINVSPLSSITYTITVIGFGNQVATAAAILNVYIPPSITLSVSKNSIIVGECVTLSWFTTGDANTIQWLSQNINNFNLTSSATVCPTDSVTYIASVSGLGGTDSDSIKITVNQTPTINLVVPSNIKYGDNTSFEYQSSYCNISLNLKVLYRYFDGTTIQIEDVNLPSASSSELNGINSSVSGTRNLNIEYNNLGPRYIDVIMTALGEGGQITIGKTIEVLVDRTPDNVIVPETDNLLKDEEPVVTPETDVLSDLIFIDGIDIPVEIKSDFPIFVDKNKSADWSQLREIGTPPPAGSSIPEQDPLILKSRSLPNPGLENPPEFIAQQNLNVAYENLVTCISIIDESSPSVSTHQSDWSSFRNNYPFRTFYLLQPAINSDGSIRYNTSRMNMPNNYINDPYANGTIQVNRDDGNVNLRSDWFALCNLDQVPPGSYVSVWLDVSGSMVYNTVAASYQYFEQRCAAAGLLIVLETSNSGERWIPGHNQDLPPNGQLYIIDPDTGNEVTTVRIAGGECVELTWFIFGEITNASITELGELYQNPVGSQLGFVDSAIVCPEVDTTYQLIVNGPAGNTFRSVFVDTLTAPTIIFTVNPGTSISAGSCVIISWQTTGDADEIIWTSGNITNGNLTSSETVCPQDTTTYCAYADGEAGQSPPKCVTIIVSQAPTASISSPSTINYGDDLFVNFNTEYANTSITITTVYTYIDGSSSTGVSVNITPVAESAEIGGGSGNLNTVVSDTNYQIPILWDDNGPISIQVIISAQGTGGTKTDTSTTNVIIDRTPDNITIDETTDKPAGEDPVYTPDIVPDEVILSQLYLIEGIDVPVEIKSDTPIKVDINNSNTWKDLREI